MEQERKQRIWLGFIPAGFLLLLYPAVLIANIMSFAAETSGDESALVLLAVNGFLWVSTLYPVSFIIGLVKYKKADTEEKKKKAVALPYKHIGVAVLFLFFWALIGE